MKLTLRLALLMTVPPLVWAGNAVVGRLIAGQVPPNTLNLLRWSLAALLLLPLAWRSLRAAGGWAPVRQRWRYLLLLGLLSVALYNSMQYLALISSTALNVTLVASSLPAWMMAVGALAFGVRPSPRQVLGAAMSMAGVALVIARGSPAALLAVQFVPGDLYIVVAVIGWSCYSWLLARPPAHLTGAERPGWDWAAFLFVQVAFGVLGAAVLSGWEQAAGAAPIQWSGGVAAALLFFAIGPSLLAYRCWGIGVAEGGPAVAAAFGNLTPLFAALLSTWLLGEAPQGYHAAAFALIVGGIAVASRGR